MSRSTGYYVVRGLVRLAFWTAVILAGLTVFAASVWVMWAVML